MSEQWIEAPKQPKWVMMVKTDLPQPETAYLCTPRAEVIKVGTRLEAVGYADGQVGKPTICAMSDDTMYIIPVSRVRYMQPVEVVS